MDNLAIIRGLEYTKAVYADAVATNVDMAQFINLLCHEMIDKGLCGFLRCSFPEDHSFLMRELKKDKVGDHNYSYWYTAPMSVMLKTVEDIQQQSLQPRLDHLNRTITRLQAELKTVEYHG